MHFSIAIALLSFFTVRKIQWQELRAGEKTNECGKTYIARDRDNHLFHNEFSHQYEFRVSRASALSVLRMGGFLSLEDIKHLKTQRTPVQQKYLVYSI